MQAPSLSRIPLALAILLAAPLASAHGDAGTTSGLLHGFMHPATGLDHLLVAIMAGYWAGRCGDHGTRDIAALLVLFAAGMLLGAVNLAWLQLELVVPAVLVLTAVVIATVIAYTDRFGHVLFGGLAVFHGLSHMQAMPVSTGSLAGFAIGVFLSTGVLLMVGHMLRTVVSTRRPCPESSR